MSVTILITLVVLILGAGLFIFRALPEFARSLNFAGSGS